jgi:uncharacterized protein YndB with AHSA1/START domain
MSEPMILRARVAAPLKEVQHALTDAGALRAWLAEHAEVELPHRYEFWGRYTPEGDAPHQRLLHVDDDTVRLAWFLGGVETTTEIRLTAESAESTVVSLSQTDFDFADAMSGANIRGVLQTFWSLAIANLVDHVEGRPLTPRTDFTSAEFREEILIAAPASAIFQSLSDSEQASEWFGFPIGIEPHVGGRFAMGGLENNPQPARILDLEAGQRMSVDWGPVGVTSWELAESDGKTRLTFVQSGFDEQNPPYAAWTGWLSGVAALRRYPEVAPWRSIWLAEEPADDAAATPA